MDIVISTFEGAIRDGITLLCQRRLNSNPTTPPYLRRPNAPLFVEVVFIRSETTRKPAIRTARVLVRCASWGDTKVFLELMDLALTGVDWHVRGDFQIRYGADYPIPALTTKEVSRFIEPVSFKKNGDNRPMRYRIRTRIIR